MALEIPADISPGSHHNPIVDNHYRIGTDGFGAYIDYPADLVMCV
jgi:hypothetical protein